MEFFEVEYRIVLAVMCCAFFVWCLFRAPAATALLGITKYFMSGIAIVGPLKYVYLVTVLQVATVLLLLARAAFGNRLGRIPQMLRHPRSLFLFVLVVVWGKIGFDCAYFGLNEVRVFDLKSALNIVVLPSAICFLSFVTYPPEQVVADLRKGLCGFFGIIMLLPLASAALDGRLVDSVVGSKRLLLYGGSPIETGVFLLYTYVGASAALVLPKMNAVVRYLLMSWMLALLFAIVLNGTRQAALGVVIATGVLALYHHKQKAVIVFLLLFAAGFATAIVNGVVTRSSAAERMQLDIVASDTRFAEYWAPGLQMLLEHPLLGVGFRNFGFSFEVHNPDTGEINVRQDNAHGFFQDVFVEHGLVLGIASLIAFAFTFGSVLSDRVIPAMNRSLVLSLLALCSAALLSGGVSSSFAFPFVAIIAVGITDSVKQESLECDEERVGYHQFGGEQ